MPGTGAFLREEAETLFRSLDRAGRGWISLEEASIVVTTLGLELSPEEIVDKLPSLPHPLDSTFSVDVNMLADGRIGCNEFMTLLGATSHINHDDVFDILDVDKDGRLGIDDLRGHLGAEATAAVEELGDGAHITRDQFTLFMRGHN